MLGANKEDMKLVLINFVQRASRISTIYHSTASSETDVVFRLLLPQGLKHILRLYEISEYSTAYSHITVSCDVVSKTLL